MASLAGPCVRHTFRSLTSRHPRFCQRRWAQVHDVRFLATHGAHDRVQAKYKDKLDQKAKEEGLKDVNELKEVYRSKITELRKKAIVPGANAPLDALSDNSTAPSTSRLHDPPPPAPEPATSKPARSSGSPSHTDPAGIKTLASYLDIAKALELTQQEIEYIWRLRHASSEDSLCAVIPQKVWTTIHANARKHPQFVLPLPREGQEGAEIHFLQWAFPTTDTVTVLFTNLAEYKLRGEYASPHTVLTFHLELLGPKGLSLAQGQVVKGRGVTVDEGKWLLMCVQKFYGLQGEQNESRKQLLEQFSKGDGNFKIEAVLDEAEKAV